MVLGVAGVWNDRKGLYDFIELSKILDTDEYVVVLIGLSEKLRKMLSKTAPNMIALPRTNSKAELAKYYSAADVYINPSYEETYGMTTAEAQACGTYSIVYKGTACAEVIDTKNGEIVDAGPVNVAGAIVQRFKKAN